MYQQLNYDVHRMWVDELERRAAISRALPHRTPSWRAPSRFRLPGLRRRRTLAPKGPAYARVSHPQECS